MSKTVITASYQFVTRLIQTLSMMAINWVLLSVQGISSMKANTACILSLFVLRLRQRRQPLLIRLSKSQWRKKRRKTLN